MINTSIQIEIGKLSAERYELIDIKEAAWNDETKKYDIDEGEYDARIDEYAVRIMELIERFNIELPFEFIIEELTKLGDAPCILYDDNGHFAITSEGAQSVCFGDAPMDCELQFSVEAEYWKDTMREALEHYLTR